MRGRLHISRPNWLSLVVLAMCLAAPLAAFACPNCKLSVADQDGSTGAGGITGASGDMAAGYAYSIYLMLLVPAVLATGLVFFIRRQVQETAAPPPEA